MVEPRVTLTAAHSSDGDNLPIRRIVIHATCGGRGYPRESAAGVARQTAQYFQNVRAGGSAHYVEDVAHEEHCLADDVIAWHAPPNPNSLGIEICADGGEPYRKFKPYTREQWLSPQVWPAVERAARRTRELAERHGLPLRKLTVAQVRAGKKGICGHADVSAAFGESSHTDPGPTFPWDEFMAVVRAPEQQEEPTVKIVSLGLDKVQQIAPGKTIAISWNVEYSDTAELHTDGGTAVLADGACWCLADALVRLLGLKTGDRAEVAWTRFTRDGKTVKDDAWGWVRTQEASDADRLSVTQLGGQFQLDGGCQLRLRVRNPLDYAITVQAGTMAKLTLVPR